MKWRPTPPSILVTAERLMPDGTWGKCRVADLKRGDVFRVFFGGEQIDESGQFPVDGDHVAVCAGDAFRASEETTGRDHGYAVEIVASGKFEDVMKRMGN